MNQLSRRQKLGYFEAGCLEGFDEGDEVGHVLRAEAGFETFGHEALAGGGGALDLGAGQGNLGAAHHFEGDA